MTRPAAQAPNSDGGTFSRSLVGLLALQHLPRVGPKTALKLALADVELSELEANWGDALVDAQEHAEQELAQSKRMGITVIGFFDDAYPDRLRTLHTPPLTLYVRGSVDAVTDPRAVAIVGTREPTSFGCSATEEVSAALASKQWTIVSGLAKGIDTLAHGAALKHHTRTVAVMGGGLSNVYPHENTELAEAIVDQGGALVSEQPLDAQPRPNNLVARNRLQTALSIAVVVAQTGTEGGTPHTARHAATQGRPIFCPVPHSDHARNLGLRALLERPGPELCDLLPAWKSARELCASLPDRPIARPIVRDHLDEFLAFLEERLAACTGPAEDRWWPLSRPPLEEPDHTDDDAISFAA